MMTVLGNKQKSGVIWFDSVHTFKIKRLNCNWQWNILDLEEISWYRAKNLLGYVVILWDIEEVGP